MTPATDLVEAPQAAPGPSSATTASPAYSLTPGVPSEPTPTDAPRKRVEGRTFQLSFPLPGKMQHSPKPGKKAKTPEKTGKKKAKPNEDNTGKPDQPVRPKSNRKEYEKSRNQRPERKEYNRQHQAESRNEAKRNGLCTECQREPALKRQTRCQKCSEKHRAEGREARLNSAVRAQAKARAKRHHEKKRNAAEDTLEEVVPFPTT